MAGKRRNRFRASKATQSGNIRNQRPAHNVNERAPVVDQHVPRNKSHELNAKVTNHHVAGSKPRELGTQVTDEHVARNRTSELNGQVVDQYAAKSTLRELNAQVVDQRAARSKPRGLISQVVDQDVAGSKPHEFNAQVVDQHVARNKSLELKGQVADQHVGGFKLREPSSQVVDQHAGRNKPRELNVQVVDQHVARNKHRELNAQVVAQHAARNKPRELSAQVVQQVEKTTHSLQTERSLDTKQTVLDGDSLDSDEVKSNGHGQAPLQTVSPIPRADQYPKASRQPSPPVEPMQADQHGSTCMASDKAHVGAAMMDAATFSKKNALEGEGSGEVHLHYGPIRGVASGERPLYQGEMGMVQRGEPSNINLVNAEFQARQADMSRYHPQIFYEARQPPVLLGSVHYPNSPVWHNVPHYQPYEDARRYEVVRVGPVIQQPAPWGDGNVVVHDLNMLPGVKLHGPFISGPVNKAYWAHLDARREEEARLAAMGTRYLHPYLKSQTPSGIHAFKPGFWPEPHEVSVSEHGQKVVIEGMPSYPFAELWFNIPSYSPPADGYRPREDSEDSEELPFL